MNRLILIGLAAAVITACNPSTQNPKGMAMNNKKTGMIEITSFKLNRGVTAEDFEQSALSMQKDFLEKQNGFVKRALTVSQDSVWTDIVFWQDQESAEKTMQLAERSDLVAPFLEKIDFHSVKMALTTPILIEE